MVSTSFNARGAPPPLARFDSLRSLTAAAGAADSTSGPNHGQSGPNTTDIRIALLGVGCVGSAVAAVAASTRSGPHASARHIHVTSGLVRTLTARNRPTVAASLPLTTDAGDIFASNPDVVVEVLGGLEPARTLVLEALTRGTPVVTANKSLLAHHGDELFEAAAIAGVPLCYEAAVIAGVPFLSTFARRPLASRIDSLAGIVNGTTNYILTAMQEEGASYAAALERAQAFGFAEPDPSKDVGGIDAVEKLTILIRQFAGLSVHPDDIETTGITHVTLDDLTHARELGGTVKPIVRADWRGRELSAFAGPAFVPFNHPLARLRGSTNGVCLRDVAGSDLFLSGPGAGPDVTAVTILDDVYEARAGRPLVADRAKRVERARVTTPASPWLVRIETAGALPTERRAAHVLSAYNVSTQRASAVDTRDGRSKQWLLTHSCTREQIADATSALCTDTRQSVAFVRAVNDERT